MTFQEEKEFFAGLTERPEWLNKTEWKVLKVFYAYSNPSIPVVLNRVATQLIGGQIRNHDEGYRAAERSYKSGRPKVKARVAAEQPRKPQQAQTSSHRPPWWTYDN
jgi:hypothetical protein